MKKLILTAFTLLTSLALVNAGGELRSTPRGDPQALATADYGGVYVSTNNQTSLLSGAGVHYSTITIGGGGVFYGVIFSTGTTADFFDVWDATSSDNAKLIIPFTRIYNVSASSGGVGAFAAGFSGPSKPIRYGSGLIGKSSSNGYNSISVLYYREP